MEKSNVTPLVPKGEKKGNEFDVMIVYWGNLNVTKC